MFFLEVDISSQLALIFNFINSCYNFLNSLEFSAFGFHFTLLGILLSLILLVLLINFLKFGVEIGASTTIRYRRRENRRDELLERRGKARWI